MNTSIAGHRGVRNGVIQTGAVALMLGAALAMNGAQAAENDVDDSVARPAPLPPAPEAAPMPAPAAPAAPPAQDAQGAQSAQRQGAQGAQPAPPAPPSSPKAAERARVRSDADRRMREAQRHMDEAQRRLAQEHERAMNQTAAERADIEERLREAQERLSRAASEVAAIASERAAEAYEKFGDDWTPRRTVIGADLDPQSKDGARVLDVSPGGPAEEAGLRAGDVITMVDGKTVESDGTPGAASRMVSRWLRQLKPDTKVKVRALRDGKPKDFEIVPRAMGNAFAFSVPAVPSVPNINIDVPQFKFNYGGQFFGNGDLAGLEVTTLTPQLGRYFGATKGVLVVRAPKSDVYQLQDGDVIVSIDGREPTSGSHITRILSSYQPGEQLTLRVMRDHKQQDIKVTVPERNPRRARVSTTWVGEPM